MFKGFGKGSSVLDGDQVQELKRAMMGLFMRESINGGGDER